MSLSPMKKADSAASSGSTVANSLAPVPEAQVSNSMKKSKASPMKKESPMKKKPAVVMKKRAAADVKDGEAPAKKSKKEKWPDAIYRAYGEPRTAIPWPRVIRKPGGNFKVISWNVAGLRTFLEKRADQLKDVVSKEKPDAIAFMETKLQQSHEKDMETALAKIAPDYEVTWNSCTDPTKKGYAGVAYLAKKNSIFKPSSVRPVIEGFLPHKEKEKEGRLLIAEYDQFVCVSVYTPNSGANLERLDWRVKTWDKAYREMAKKQKKPLVLIGDFNAAHLDEDIWNLNISKDVPTSAGTTPEERASFDKLLKECQLVDAFRFIHGGYKDKGEKGTKYFSYWSQRAKNKDMNRGLRLDYCLISGGWRDKIVDGFFLKEHTNQFGDHCPVGVTMKL